MRFNGDKTLKLNNMGLIQLPYEKIPNDLEQLYCFKNQLQELHDLPSGLRFLRCHTNRLTNIDDLPDSLESLDVAFNFITDIKKLPKKLKELEIEGVGNELKSVEFIWSVNLKYLQVWCGLKCNSEIYKDLELYSKVTNCEIYYSEARA